MKILLPNQKLSWNYIDVIVLVALMLISYQPTLPPAKSITRNRNTNLEVHGSNWYHYFKLREVLYGINFHNKHLP